MITHIFISPQRKAPLEACAQVDVVAGQGIRGDRYFGVAGSDGPNLTLVEAEQIEAFCARTERPIDYAITRRNLVTRGIDLNSLVGVEFQIGRVVVKGVELCEPCTVLGRQLATPALASPAVVKDWVGRGGLRVNVLSSGQITVGDPITIHDLFIHHPGML